MKFEELVPPLELCTRIPWRGKPEEDCPDSPRYKACGNSMCVNVMRWIGMRIELAERKGASC